MALPLPLKKIIYCNGFESTEIIKDKFVKLLSTYAIVANVLKTINRILTTRFLEYGGTLHVYANHR
jgi:hypothetical protein